MDRLLRRLREMIGALERELDRATRELAFVRASEGVTEPRAPRPEAGPNRDRPGGQSTFEASGIPPVPRRSLTGAFGPPSLPGRFGRFTVALYNRTVDDIRRRHRLVAPLMLLLSVAIGLTIVIVTLLFGSYSAPLWIALLPTVWLIPVPFFVLTYRGTQRMLHRDHLRLPEET